MSCRHHQPQILNLSFDGQVYSTRGQWEQDPTTIAALLKRMEEALAGDARQFAAHWLRPEVAAAFRSYLELPLSPPIRRRMGHVAARLCAATEGLPAACQTHASYLAARLCRLAGQTREAANAYRESLRLAGDSDITAPLRKPRSRVPSRRGREALVEALLKAEMARQHLPGLSVAVIRDGQVALAEGYGLANVELSAPAGPETVYELASMTKLFTGTAIMLLTDEGEISLDDRVAALLSDLPAAWSGITVRHLLTHTSGIRDVFNAPNWPGTREHTLEVYLGLVADLPLDFPPGEKYNYSNTGYILLGMIIEKVSGKPLGDCLAERIFQPLGMAATGVVDFKRIVKNRAAGYVWRDGALWNDINGVGPQGAIAAPGGLASSVVDLAKLDAVIREETLLRRPVLEGMWAPVKLPNGETRDYGLGWGLGSYRGRRHVGHGGRTHGFSSEFQHFVDAGLTIIVLCNADQPGVAGRLVREVAAVYLPHV